MTYFELFDIPVSLKPDQQMLPARFFELSRKFHPDYHVNLPPREQAEVLEKAALLNKAFRTLKDQDATIKYVLMLKGLLEEEEKYALPPEFLMEVMDLNEQLMDLDGLNREVLGENVKKLQQEIYEPVQEIVEHYQEAVTGQKELLQVKEYYFKKKYLQRILDRIAG